jgi:hypothetical protein
MGGAGVTLRVDARPLEAALGAARALLAEAPDGVLEGLERLLGPGDAAQQLVAVETDVDAAARTGELVVRLEPSDALRRLLAAAGAGDV